MSGRCTRRRHDLAKYLVLYRSDQSAREQMAQATPEQAKAGMDAWIAWMGTAGDAIVDFGSPVSGGDESIGGYSILQADSQEALDAVLAEHPHRQVGTIETLEFLALPGM